MENASQALIIAGAVLIAVMILSLGVYLFSTAGTLSQSYDEKLKQDAIDGFNITFLAYEKDITAQDMVTLINLIKENNQKNSDISEKQVALILDGSMIDTANVSEQWKIDIMKQVSVTKDPNYRFVSIQYNNSGYVNRMEYKTIH